MGTHGSDLRDAGAGQLARPADRAAPPVHLLSRALAGLRMEPCGPRPDRKSTRLNSSHVRISYAVFCLKKKKYIMKLPRPSTHRSLTARLRNNPRPTL